jgi:hypothetical protein
MRTIIAGSRDICDIQLVCEAVEQSGFEISVILSGKARGIDLDAIEFAKINGIPWEEYPAKWTIDGVFHPEAGMVRNAEMVAKADALIAIWNGRSKGTRGMVEIATKRGLKVYVHKAT